MADKLKDYNNGFHRGLEVTYDKAVEGGKDAILEEIRYRGRCKKTIPLSKSDIGKLVMEIKGNVTQTILAMSMLVLHDEFGFGRKRLEQFSERFAKKTKCMADPENLFCWQDVKDILMDECGVDTAIDIIEEDNREREKHGKRGE